MEEHISKNVPAKEWIGVTKAAKLLGVPRLVLNSMIERGCISYLANGTRKLLNVEQAREELKAAAENNRDNVEFHRGNMPYSREKIANKVADNWAPRKGKHKIRPVALGGK